MRVLFTGGGGAASSALACMFPCVHFADADPLARPHRVPASQWHQIPFAEAPAFIPELTALCQRLKIDLLVPGVDGELLKLAMARDWKALPCPVLLPETEFIATHLDKLRSMRTLRELGISVPQTWRHAIVKPREGRGSRDVRRIGHSDGMVIQEYLEGQEYTVTVVADTQKRLRAIVPVKVGLKRGVTLRAETDADPDVMNLCRAIHTVQPFSGCVNVQCIRDEDGVVRPFEINPRVSTTMCVAIAAGVDVISLYLDEGSVDGLESFQVGRTLTRSWHTEFGMVS